MVVVYGDSLSDEILAREWLQGGVFSVVSVVRLPSRSGTSGTLRDLLEWERLDWIIEQNGVLKCAVELSRHGYTGDQSFQRFARLYRCAQLGIPVIYFTSFNRTRLNEIEDGRLSPRNVAPELFQTLETMSRKFNVPCLAVDWPTGTDGTPLPLGAPAAREALTTLTNLVRYFTENGNPGPNASVERDFPEVLRGMRAQAALPWTGTVTRSKIRLPIDLSSRDWILAALPGNYFEIGKADKALASLALNSLETRPMVGPNTFGPWWEEEGSVRILFLGYQWRPDPACGLIALSAAQATAEDIPLIVVWPRIFYSDGEVRRRMLLALEEFSLSGTGALADEARRLGFDADKIEGFKARVSTDSNQFGIFGAGTKTGRILAATSRAIVLGDAIYAF